MSRSCQEARLVQEAVSRTKRILWGLLALVAVAPMIDATMGCSFKVIEAGPILANAVECACDFSGAGARTLRVQASSDDAEQDGVSMDLTNGDLDLANKHVGLRFAAVGLPADAQIQSAYVQFTADETQSTATVVTIQAQASAAAPTFSTTDADVTLRTPGQQLVTWTIDPWTNDAAGPAQKTPELKALLQELVELPGWSSASPVVLRISGAGHRTAESFDGDANQAPQLVVSFSTTVTATVPTCVADPVRDANGFITAASATAQCNALADTFGGLNDACGLPTTTTCSVVDRKDPNGNQAPDSFERSVCEQPCVPNEVDGSCTEYDPIAFASCVASGMPIDTCKATYASATHAAGDEPICVASGSALAFHAFGRRSLCEVEGSSEITIGDREPEQDPDTAGTVEIQGEPCPGNDCYVHPFFLLDMEPVTFSVRWASDPTFKDLGAAGGGLDTAFLDGGLASFAPDSVEGTGRGRRGSDGVAVDATNSDVLDVGVDWSGRTCNMIGSLAVGVGDDGLCEDDTTVCRVDADCAGIGNEVCVLPPDDADQMNVAVTLGGELVNQPPRAVAGANQTVECTSSAGASFVLNGRGSSDPEPNLALASWRAGSRTGAEISNDLVTTQALGVGGSQSYVLRVIDSFAQLDEDTTSIAVVDTTPPVIACNAPATVRPPDAEQGLSFAATATDVCDDVVSAEVTAFDCFTYTRKDRYVSKLESCVVSFAGDTLTIHDVGGYGDVIQWTVEATDDSGNVGQTTCQVVVAK